MTDTQRVKTFKAYTQFTYPIFAIGSKYLSQLVSSVLPSLAPKITFKLVTVDETTFLTPDKSASATSVSDPVAIYALLRYSFQKNTGAVPPMGMNLTADDIGDVLRIPAQALKEAESNHNQGAVVVYNAPTRVVDGIAAIALLLDAKLNKTLDDAVEPHYQPKFEVESIPTPRLGQVKGVEALMRVCIGDNTYATPFSFGAAADTLGLTPLLDKSVRTQAIAFASQLVRRGYFLPVGINCQGDELVDHTFLDEFKAMLGRYHVPSVAVELELTEVPRNATTDSLNGAIDVWNHEYYVTVTLDDALEGVHDPKIAQRLHCNGIKFDPLIWGDGDSELTQAAKDLIRLYRRRNGPLGRVVGEKLDDLHFAVAYGFNRVQAFEHHRPVRGAEILDKLSRGYLQTSRYARQ